MSNLEKYVNVFMETLGVKAEETDHLEYMGIDAWDSVGHMTLIAALEDVFGIMMETDDIVDFNSFQKGKELLSKYGIEI